MMTPEQRLDRLERIAKLFIKAGLRARHNMRELDEKIGMLVSLQIQNEERFSKLDQKTDMLINSQIRTDERFVRTDERFAKFEIQTERTLQALLEIVRKVNGALLRSPTLSSHIKSKINYIAFLHDVVLAFQS